MFASIKHIILSRHCLFKSMNVLNYCQINGCKSIKNKRLQMKIPPPDYSKLLCNVTGLSPCVLNPQTTSDTYEERLTGVSKSGVYKNPEYFAYHLYSFNQAMLELAVYRLPQPSALGKLFKPKSC